MEPIDFKGPLPGAKGIDRVYQIQRRHPESRDREFARYLKQSPDRREGQAPPEGQEQEKVPPKGELLPDEEVQAQGMNGDPKPVRGRFIDIRV